MSYLENTVRWTSPVDAPTASMMELQRLSCDLQHKAGRAEVDVLAQAVANKASITDVAELRSAVACLAKDVGVKAELCALDRLRDQTNGIAASLGNFATKFEVANVQGIVQNFTGGNADLAAKVDALSCEPCIDPRLSSLARTLWGLICQARDGKANVDTQIAAVSDPQTKLALSTMSTTLFDLIFSILGAFNGVKAEGGCGGN